ncbi:MAG: hypothetical protein HY703_02915, partial [Gemmatimonadetes bacterium]|nr:hypothetical protein [Gemmatimonadota bacterium]
MRIRVLLLAAALVSPGAGNGAAAQADSTRMYGRITTVDGERYEGYIRWDKNEASWADILDATKEIRPARRSGKAVLEQRRVRVLGIPVGWRRHVGSARAFRSAQSGIRFGHILTLEPRGDGARLVLVSGREIELESGGDLGDAVRGIVIQDPRSQVELGWDDVRRIEFLTAPEAASRPSAERLYGRLETRGGQRFTGYVAWDMD